MKTTLLLADLHLEDSEVARTEWFLSFLDGPAQSAEAVYILGDLFEFWIGDDALSECARQVAIKTSALNEMGIPCYFIHGNRDFLLGEGYAGTAGIQLLPETRGARSPGYAARRRQLSPIERAAQARPERSTRAAHCR